MASRTEWPAAANSGLTYAPTEIMEEVVPPGAPTEDSAGPEFPAELTKMTPCLLTTYAYSQQVRGKPASDILLNY